MPIISKHTMLRRKNKANNLSKRRISVTLFAYGELLLCSAMYGFVQLKKEKQLRYKCLTVCH